MSEITPELKLTYLEGSNPKHYSLQIKIDEQATHPNLIISHDGGNMVTPNTEYVVSLELGEAEGAAESTEIDMGQIPFDNDESIVKVQIIQNGTGVGEGKVRVKEAQLDTRPIGKDL